MKMETEEQPNATQCCVQMFMMCITKTMGSERQMKVNFSYASDIVYRMPQTLRTNENNANENFER